MYGAWDSSQQHLSSKRISVADEANRPISPGIPPNTARQATSDNAVVPYHTKRCS